VFVHNVRKLIKTLKIQMTSINPVRTGQINYNAPIPYVRDNDPNCFGHFIFDFWNLFDIYYLLFGALYIKSLTLWTTTK